MALAPDPALFDSDVFAEALRAGAPAGAVTGVTYDQGGYAFSVSGRGMALRYDAACQPKSR